MKNKKALFALTLASVCLVSCNSYKTISLSEARELVDANSTKEITYTSATVVTLLEYLNVSVPENSLGLTADFVKEIALATLGQQDIEVGEPKEATTTNVSLLYMSVASFDLTYGITEDDPLNENVTFSKDGEKLQITEKMTETGTSAGMTVSGTASYSRILNEYSYVISFVMEVSSTLEMTISENNTFKLEYSAKLSETYTYVTA